MADQKESRVTVESFIESLLKQLAHQKNCEIVDLKITMRGNDKGEPE